MSVLGVRGLPEHRALCLQGPRHDWRPGRVRKDKAIRLAIYRRAGDGLVGNPVRHSDFVEKPRLTRAFAEGGWHNVRP